MFPFWFKWNGLIFIKTPVTAGDQGQGGGGAKIPGNYERNSGRSQGQTSSGPLSVGGQGARGHPKAPQAPLMTPTQSWRAPQGGWEKTRGHESNSGKKKRWPQETPTHCFASFIRARVNSLGSRHVCLCFHSASPSQTPDPGVFGQIVSNPAVLIYCCRVNGCILNSPIYAHTRVYPPAPGGAQINNVQQVLIWPTMGMVKITVNNKLAHELTRQMSQNRRQRTL